MTITAVIAARNESAALGRTLAGLRRQTRPPDRVVVVDDGSVDNTADVAVAAGADVVTATGNRHRKAGALNQALARILPTLDTGRDLVYVGDADTDLAPDFLARAAAACRGRVAAVGARLSGGPGGGALGALQRSEYARLYLGSGSARVLSGAATLFRAAFLADVAAARAVGTLPGSGGIFNVDSVTEDFELTLAAHRLGWTTRLRSTATTAIAPTLGGLWAQRVRWQMGLFADVARYGPTSRAAAAFTLRQVGVAAYLATTVLIVAYTVAVVTVGPGLTPRWWWLGLTGFFALEATATAHPRSRWLSAAYLPEIGYGLFKYAVWLRCCLLHRATPEWR